MADETKLWIVIEAKTDDKQVEQEVNRAGDVAQKTLNKKELTIKYNENLVELKEKLEQTRVAYENMLRTATTSRDFRNLEQMELQISDIKNQIKETETALNDMGATNWPFDKIKNILTWWAIIWAVKSLGEKIIELWSNAEQSRIAFTTMLWSAEQAQALLNELSEFAKTTPFELTWIRDSAKQLLAMWVSAQEMIPTLKALWDVSAWLNVPLERLALNYWQVLTQWRLTGKELKDFTTAWVPIIDELAKNLWKSAAEIQNLASQWKITADDMVTAFQTMTSEGGRFADLMEAQANTLAWKWSNFQDTLAWIWEEIWLAIIPLLSDMVDTAAGAWDELNNMGNQWMTASELISRWIAVVLDWVRSIILAIQSWWKVLWATASWIFTIFSSIASAGADAFSTLGTNIKVWIAKWLNAAIDDINKFSSWLNNALWIDFWQIGKIEAGEFKQFENPLKDVQNAWEGSMNYFKETINEVWDDWSKYAEKVTKEFDNINDVFHWNAVELNRENTRLVKQMTDDLSKWTSGAAKKSSEDILKQQKDNLTKLRDLKIQEIEQSTTGEREKNEELLKVYDWYKNEMLKLDWKTNDELLKNAEKYVKEYYNTMQKASEQEQKATQESINKAKKYEESIEKLWDKWKEYKDKAIGNIREVNNSLAELENDFNSDIAARYNEVNKAIEDFERKNWNVDWLKWLSADTLRWFGSDEISWINIDDAIQYVELLKEMEYLNGQITDGQKELATTLDNQSESEKIILEYEKQRAVLEEQKKMYEAFANQWDLGEIGKKAIEIQDDIVKYYDSTKNEYVEIVDFKNQELARELLNQQTKLETEYQQQETALQNELELVENHSKKVLEQWQADTKAYKNELKNRADAVRSYVAEVQALLASVPSSYRAYWWTLNSWVTFVGENWPEAIVARQSSYVQPRNAVQTYSTINNNNQSSFSINWMNINVNSVDEFLNELKNHLTYRN